jgi:hypothetical protein
MSQSSIFMVKCHRYISPLKFDFGLTSMLRPTAEVGEIVGHSLSI